ncbi:MAG: type II toxin-antitoxin system HicA family toxin [Aridibacter sp.]
MPKINPIKRKDLIKYFRKLGFDGPFSGGNHDFLKKDNLKIRMPNPHQGDISKGLLVRILKQANVDRDTWENL